MPEQAASIRKAVHLLVPSLSGVPIFNYHGLADLVPPEVAVAARQFWLTPAKFRSHLVHIRENGFQTILLDPLKSRVLSPAPELRNVALTFDDGLLTDYETAFPLLAGFGMKATFFLNTATIGQDGYLNWAKIAEMQRHGMSFQSHSHRHLDLTVLPTPALDAELAESKQRLEDHLGAQVDFIAAPRGVLDRRVIRRALLIGYRAVCSTRCWPARPGSTVITRVTLHREVQIEEFRGFLTGEFWPYACRLSRGLLLRPLGVAGHLWGILRYRWLNQPAAISK
jgi:peptidoglycan/xylan/chitin deacetylase (PgdA/CDA1 family)